jgi:hypothetical protein
VNVHRVSDDRQIEIYTSEPSVPDPSPSQVETAIAKLKTYKSPGSDEIPAERIQAGGETSQSENHTLIDSIRIKEKLPDQWNSILSYKFTRRAIELTVVPNGTSLLTTSYKILSNILLSRFSPCMYRRNYWGSSVWVFI